MKLRRSSPRKRPRGMMTSVMRMPHGIHRGDLNKVLIGIPVCHPSNGGKRKLPDAVREISISTLFQEPWPPTRKFFNRTLTTQAVCSQPSVEPVHAALHRTDCMLHHLISQKKSLKGWYIKGKVASIGRDSRNHAAKKRPNPFPIDSAPAREKAIDKSFNPWGAFDRRAHNSVADWDCHIRWRNEYRRKSVCFERTRNDGMHQGS